MKKILVPTDFSKPAHNAARYAINLARGIKSNIEICHAMLVPMESPFATELAWPIDDFDALKEQAMEDLHYLGHQLSGEEAGNIQEKENLEIGYVAELCGVQEIVNNLVAEKNIHLVVMGLSGKSGFTRQFLGSSSLNVINHATFPVLLIPDHCRFKGIRKIAFATDLSRSDVKVIHSLSSLAQHYNAEILITHVGRERYIDEQHQQKINDFFTEVTSKINYPKIYYRQINNANIDSGLSWLIGNSGIDMMVMVHLQRSFFSGLFKGSHTQRLAKHVHVPLLVYPEHQSGLSYFG